MINSFRTALERFQIYGLRWCIEFYFYRVFRSKPRVLRFAGACGLFQMTPAVLDGFQALRLNTYFGVSQTTHPSILRYQDKLILALTPYPYGDCFHENPCVYESFDGLSFSALHSAQPVSARSGAYKNYLSDPNLSISKNDELVLRYRETINSSDGVEHTRIWESRTSDLGTWSTPLELLDNTLASVISPATRTIDDIEYIYFVALHAGVGTVHRSRIDKFSTGQGQPVAVSGLPGSCHPWHRAPCH